ncbi:YqgQ family protein [Guptibacillus algicola]|uniref:YqgQ family protein n=1 Tax=Guptibacillus algicola TaxID=225844 RepID=UPI001CD5B541|nr:YqgQ family protein [Alkalihalobacillus algicola]MCA0986030.1 YqgQ family protein [Alkalihalobacillus algicola]
MKKTLFEVQQLLKKFGMIVYTGSRLGDLELMEEELHELYEMKMIEQELYLESRMILKAEMQKERDKNE